MTLGEMTDGNILAVTDQMSTSGLIRKSGFESWITLLVQVRCPGRGLCSLSLVFYLWLDVFFVIYIMFNH